MGQDMLDLTVQELSTIYRLFKEYEESAPQNSGEYYNNYYDEYEEQIGKKLIASLLKKIGNNLLEEAKEKLDKDFLRRKYHTFNNNVEPKVYAILSKALKQQKTIEIKYFNMESAEFHKRNINLYYTSAKYTIGYCHLRKALRKFRTSRIAFAKMTGSKYKIPADFNKNDYPKT